MAKIKVDLHVHTKYSFDCLTAPDQLIKACLKKGIHCIAITDHNEIEGALLLKKMAPPSLKVIVGEEIRTAEGEIIGLFLKKRIPPLLPPAETIRRIRAQGGLVYLPHPFLRVSDMRLHSSAIHALRKQFDIVEGYNARNVLKVDDAKARTFARKYDIAVGAGSDAHSRFEVGRACVLMNDFRTKKEFLRNIRSGIILSRKTAVFYPLFSLAIRQSHRKKRQHSLRAGDK